MEYLMVAVYDKVAKKVLSPWFTDNQETAKRQFASHLKNIEVWKENPEQFELIDMGLVDGETGCIVGLDKDGTDHTLVPETICKGSDLIG